jgi:hypothetical protein
VQEIRDLHLLRALKEGGHKWSPSAKRDRRGVTLSRRISGCIRSDRAYIGATVLIWECKGHKASLIVPVLSELSGISEFRSRPVSSYRGHCTPTLGRVGNH